MMMRAAFFWLLLCWPGNWCYVGTAWHSSWTWALREPLRRPAEINIQIAVIVGEVMRPQWYHGTRIGLTFNFDTLGGNLLPGTAPL